MAASCRFREVCCRSDDGAGHGCGSTPIGWRLPYTAEVSGPTGLLEALYDNYRLHRPRRRTMSGWHEGSGAEHRAARLSLRCHHHSLARPPQDVDVELNTCRQPRRGADAGGRPGDDQLARAMSVMASFPPFPS